MKLKKILPVMAFALVAVSSAVAQTTTPVDYGETLTTNLTTINNIWGIVATTMIGSALVTVGVRFFRKTK